MGDETNYNDAEGWARELRIPVEKLLARLRTVPAIPFRGGSGKIVSVYAETDVISVCADLLKNVRRLGTL